MAKNTKAKVETAKGAEHPPAKGKRGKRSPAAVEFSSAPMDLNLEEVGAEEQEIRTSDIAPTFKWEEPGQQLKGKVVGFKEGIGDNESRIFIVQTEDKGPVSLWECAGLRTLFAKGDALVGFVIRIVYAEKVKVQGRRQPMRTFRVFLSR